MQHFKSTLEHTVYKVGSRCAWRWAYIWVTKYESIFLSLRQDIQGSKRS
jgi:hypothetical protein